MFKTTRALSLALLSLSTAQAAFAADPWPKAYDATYENKSNGTTSTMRMLSNGKGLMRTDNVINGMTTSSILDYPKKTCYTIMEAQKMIMKSPLTTEAGKVMDAAEAKKLKATDLGNKMVNGHMSHGWSYKNAQGTTEQWYDEAAQLLTKSSSKMEGMSTEMNLKSASSAVPDESKFKVPTTGYKVMGQ